MCWTLLTEKGLSAQERLQAARQRAADVMAGQTQAVESFMTKAFVPPGFYNFLAVTQYRLESVVDSFDGSISLVSLLLESCFALFPAIASVMDCPTNLYLLLALAVFHIVFTVFVHPHITMARNFANFVVDFLLIVGLVLMLRTREFDAMIVFSSTLIVAAAFNLIGAVFTFVRSESLRQFVKRQKKVAGMKIASVERKTQPHL